MNRFAHATNGIAPMAARLQELAAQALRGARATTCDGCGQTFELIRENQRHCRPSCRQLSIEQRGKPADYGLFE